MTEFCEIHRDDWGAYLRGGLDAYARDEMFEHVRAGCEDCAKRFDEARAAAGLMRLDERESELAEPAAHYASRPRWRFWSVAPWVAAAVFFGLFVTAERALLNLQKQMLDARQMNPVTNHMVRAAQSRDGAPSSENDHDLQATIEQLRGSLDQANQQLADAQRDAARFQTDLKAAQIQIAALDGSIRDSEERRVKAEADAASIRMQLDKAQGDARRATTLSTQNLQMMKLLESPQLHQLSLKLVSSSVGDANARVVWDAGQGLMLLAHNLPDLPEGRVYQLWILRKGQPAMANGGLVQVDSRGRGVGYVAPGEDLNNMLGVEVTDESAGGSSGASRGEQVFIGKL